MDVTSTAVSIPSIASGSTSGSTPGPAPVLSTVPQGDVPTPLENSASTEDRVHIQPLGALGALQIFLSEVRAELELPLEATIAPEWATATAPQTLIEMFLQSLPSDMTEPDVWLAAVIRAEAGLASALDRAVAAIAAWRDVSTPVTSGAEEIRASVVAVLSEDPGTPNAPANPTLLAPEWLCLAPMVARFHRRRRWARRRLIDPDLRAGGWGDAGGLDDAEDESPNHR